MLPVMKTTQAAAIDRFLPSVSDTVPATRPPAAATRFNDDTIIPLQNEKQTGKRWANTKIDLGGEGGGGGRPVVEKKRGRKTSIH